MSYSATIDIALHVDYTSTEAELDLAVAFKTVDLSLRACGLCDDVQAPIEDLPTFTIISINRSVTQQPIRLHFYNFLIGHLVALCLV